MVGRCSSAWVVTPGGLDLFTPSRPEDFDEPPSGYIFATDINSGVWVGKLTAKPLVP